MTAALKAQPDNFDAHYNLANALASEANLGSALAETGKLYEAKQHYERALRIDPNHELARENLEQIAREIRKILKSSGEAACSCTCNST